MSELGFNKIAGALLATGLGILFMKEAASVVFHTETPLTDGGYIVEVADEPAAGGGAADTGPKLPPDWGTLLTDASLPDLVAKGDKLHKVCMSCHTVENGGKNGTGPNLWQIVGRQSGTHAGYNYSDAMKAHAVPWTYDELYAFLESPKALVKGTSMSYAGMKKSEDRVALVAYLRSLSASPVAIPAPDPTRQPQAAAAPADAAAAPAAASEAAPPASGAASAATPAEAPAAPAKAG